MANYTLLAIKKLGWGAIIGLPMGVLGMAIGIVAYPPMGIPLTIGVGWIVWRYVIRPFREGERLNAIGESADATVLMIQENGTSMQMGGQLPKPGMTLDLEVHPAGKPAYRARTSAYLSMFEIQNYQPGSVVHVKFDPENPSNVVIMQRTGATGMYSS